MRPANNVKAMRQGWEKAIFSQEKRVGDPVNTGREWNSVLVSQTMERSQWVGFCPRAVEQEKEKGKEKDKEKGQELCGAAAGLAKLAKAVFPSKGGSTIQTAAIWTTTRAWVGGGVRWRVCLCRVHAFETFLKNWYRIPTTFVPVADPRSGCFEPHSSVACRPVHLPFPHSSENPGTTYLS